MRRIVFYNLLVFVVFAIVVELCLGHWFHPLPLIYCQSKYYHHDLCPGVVEMNQLVLADGGGVIENVVNQSALRVADKSQINTTTNTADFDIINIGDSFMEAHLARYGYTLSRVMEKKLGKKVLQVGTSSWAPAQYRNWLRLHPLKEGVQANLFLFMNDVTPHDPHVNLVYHGLSKETPEGLLVYLPDRKSEWKEFLRYNSFFYFHAWKAYYEWVNRPLADAQAANVADGWFSEDFSKAQHDCKKLVNYATKIEPFTYDYVIFAFDAACWPPEAQASVASVIRDIKDIQVQLGKVHGHLRILVVPPGWTFAGENMNGKEVGDYKMVEKALITTQPFAQYVQAQLSVPVVSLETVIGDLKKQSPAQEKWYLNFDGHWTEYAHRQLGEWLAEHP